MQSSLVQSSTTVSQGGLGTAALQALQLAPCASQWTVSTRVGQEFQKGGVSGVPHSSWKRKLCLGTATARGTLGQKKAGEEALIVALPQSAADLLLPFRSEASTRFLLHSACHQREHCRQLQAAVSIWLNSLASLAD